MKLTGPECASGTVVTIVRRLRHRRTGTYALRPRGTTYGALGRPTRTQMGESSRLS